MLVVLKSPERHAVVRVRPGYHCRTSHAAWSPAGQAGVAIVVIRYALATGLVALEVLPAARSLA